MAIFEKFNPKNWNTVKKKLIKQIEFFAKQLQNEKGERQELEHRIQNLVVNLGDIRTTETTEYTANNYTDYESAVVAAKKKYLCQAKWGIILTGPIIDFRSSLISGANIEKVYKEDKAKERDEAWLEEFLKANKLDDYQISEIIKMTELEGRYLLELKWDGAYKWEFDGVSELGMVKVIPRLWLNEKYNVSSDESGNPVNITFQGEDARILEENQFVYRKIGGLINDHNNPVMKIWRALTPVENVEKALRDLRRINYLFSSPKFYVKVEKKEDVKDTINNLNENWKINIISVFTGDLKVAQISMEHVAILIKEIYINIQLISSIVGIPVHWLALVDLMSNRSTAEDLGDITELAVSTERKIIFDGFNELIDKATDMQNENTGKTPIDKSAISIQPNIITDEQWRHIKEVFADLAKVNKFPLKELFKLIPGIDGDKIYEQLLIELQKDFKKEFDKFNFIEPPPLLEEEAA